MVDTPRDQPSQVATQQTVERPNDTNVVTSDTAVNIIADTEAGAPNAQPDPKPAASGAKPPASNDQNSASDKTDKSKPRNRRAERKIGRLTRELNASRADALATTQRLAELEQTVQTLSQAPAATKPEPKLDDFATPQEYAKAYSDWETPAPAPKPRATAPKATAPASAPAQAPAADSEITEFHTRGKEKFGDEFAEALAETDVAVNQYMAEFMMDSDFGPDLYIHLANNPEESVAIHDSSPYRANKALEKLQAKAAKGELDVGEEGELQIAPNYQEPAPKPKARKVSKAAAPPSSTRDGANVSVAPDPENESMDDYAARRQKDEMRRQGIVT